MRLVGSLRLRPLQVLLLLRLAVCFEEEEEEGEEGRRREEWRPPGHQPRFLHDYLTANLSIQLGATAHLHCRIAGLRDQSVSWYRKRGDEIQLITFGFQTYHNDDRFSLSFAVPSDWRLQVRSVQARDEGTYQCQVSTHPPITRTLHLHVVEAAIQILDERSVELKEKFYRTGSTIELQCRVSRVPSASALQLIWYHDDNKLNYDAPRGGVSVKTELRGTVGHSWLLVGNAMKEDSGVYSCNVTNIATASVVIHVVPEEYPAAIQQGRCLGASTCLLLLAALTHACCCCHPHR